MLYVEGIFGLNIKCKQATRGRTGEQRTCQGEKKAGASRHCEKEDAMCSYYSTQYLILGCVPPAATMWFPDGRENALSPSQWSVRPLASTVSPLYPRVPQPWIQPTEDEKYSEENFARKFQKAKLELSACWQLFTQHLHGIYNYLHRIYIALGIIINLEMI